MLAVMSAPLTQAEGGLLAGRVHPEESEGVPRVGLDPTSQLTE